MTEQVNILIVGAGQAGLCTSYYLTQAGHDHLILEQAPDSVPVWRRRWDSFTLVLPNWTVRMPGYPVPEEVKDNFFTREELVEHFEGFIATFEPRIRFNTTVSSLEQNPDGDGYLVHTDQGDYVAKHVIVATGTFQHANIPALSEQVPADIMQIHTSGYHNPDQLPPGAVLVVGTGQSGCQIAQELYQAGRKVYVSVGGAGRLQRVYRGKDTIYWLNEAHFFDVPPEKLDNSRMRFAANPVATGKNGGGDLDLHQFVRDGVTLLGRATEVNGHTMTFTPDIKEKLKKIDQFVAMIKEMIDKFIAENGIDAPPANDPPPLTDGYDQAIIETLDLKEAGINSIVWATGYRHDYSWIKLPVLDQDDFPIQKGGVSEFPGLYFMGLMYLTHRGSGTLVGVAADAQRLVETIDAAL